MSVSEGVSRARCSVFHDAPRSRDPRRALEHGPRISSAPLRAAQHSGHVNAPSHSRGARRPSCSKSFASKIRGRRESRVPAAPAAPRAKCRKHASASPQVTGTPGHPCTMVLTVSFALSPVIGLCCHRRLAETSAKLDASVEASGPHDFAVRSRRLRQERTLRPPHPAPRP
jgi:hypothetical protein